MSITQQIITVLLCMLATVLTRFLAFFVFSGKRKTPDYVQYLGNALGPAIFGMLVVYCLKSVSFLQYSYGLPEAIAIISIIGIHLWKRNTLVSIAAGTIIYMLLLQAIF